ncbi:hypothetical protein [Sandaracinus amylolyticus]|uniref:hypothetical protein n=1 Tax=Sandaracinus amylolyticus TaxID=927083 RepID=UPI001F33ECAE|nr:hypothetical protein [Sandaracinus amylolyticus]UJR80668.1 Hypothetical protein I5071_27170 [Sandaracinus amylolyticus]
MRGAALAIGVIACLVGCGEAPALAEQDAGVEGIQDPIPPTPTAAVVMTPCPPGWREHRVLEDQIVCEPWADDRAPTCAPSELALPGTGCAPIDGERGCPEDGWPRDLPVGGVIYVRPGAVDGDGTRERPFATIAEGVTAARAVGGGRGVLALSVGEHDVGAGVRLVELRGIAALRGACATGTVVRNASTESGTAVLVVTPGQTMELGDLHLIGGRSALWVTSGTMVRGSRLWLEAPAGALRLDSRAGFEGDHVRADGGQVRADDVPYAVWLRAGAQVTLRSSTVSGGGPGAIGADYRTGDPVPPGTRLLVEDSAIVDTPLGITGVIDEITVRRVAVERAGAGLLIVPGSRAELVDLRGRDVAPAAAGDPDVFLSVFGQATLARVYLSRVQKVAIGALRIVVEGPESRGRIGGADVVVDEAPGGTENVVAAGGHIELERARVERAAGSAFEVYDDGSLTLRDATVIDTALEENDGDALEAWDGGRLDVARARIVRPGRNAVQVADDARATIVDLDVIGGIGVGAQCTGECPPDAPPTLVLERARIRDASRFGLAAIDANVRATDVDLQDIVRSGQDPTGVGVLAYHGTIGGERVRVRGAASLGAAALRGGRLAIAHLRVESTRAETCDSCAIPAGDGLMCAGGGVLALREFEVSGSPRAGMTAAFACAAPELARGLVHGNAIGLLTDDRVEPSLFRGIEVRDNGTEFQTTMLVVDPPPPAL